MSNLYPQLVANNGGSFDDYDSIIDEFSIGCENSDMSSMHMSDMGEISAGIPITTMNDASPANNKTTLDLQPLSRGQEQENTRGIAPCIGGEATSMPTTELNTNDQHHNHDKDDRNDGASGYYYHVGDLYHVDTLGIDNTDMSAISGLASSSFSTTTSIGQSSASVDAESLLPSNQDADEEENDEDQHSLPSVYAIKNDVLMYSKSKHKMHEMNNRYIERIRHADDEESMNQSSVSRQLGPLGDELSYADNGLDYQQEHERHGIYEPQNADYYANNYSEEEEEEEEDDANECILPNLITYSSRRSKCVTVFSTAFILGVLVFAIVAVGVSYSSTGSINPFSSTSSINANESNGSDGGSNSESISFVDRLEDENSNMNVDSVKLPLESSTGKEVDVEGKTVSSTARPTGSLTMSGTSTAAVASSTTSLPTISPRDDDEDSPIQQQQQQQQMMTSLVPTNMPSEQTSLFLRRPSIIPTQSSNPTTQPSMSNVPSIAPTTSSQPSWPIGNESTEEGDARFYLMADGGSNRRFWANKLETLEAGPHKFLVHL